MVMSAGSLATIRTYETDIHIFSGAIPVMNEVMSATRGATEALSGVTRHLNNSVSPNF